jgi:hypothetical protein
MFNEVVVDGKVLMCIAEILQGCLTVGIKSPSIANSPKTHGVVGKVPGFVMTGFDTGMDVKDITAKESIHRCFLVSPSFGFCLQVCHEINQGFGAFTMRVASVAMLAMTVCVGLAWLAMGNPVIEGDPRGRLEEAHSMTCWTCHGVLLGITTFGSLGVKTVKCSN